MALITVFRNVIKIFGWKVLVVVGQIGPRIDQVKMLHITLLTIQI